MRTALFLVLMDSRSNNPITSLKVIVTFSCAWMFY
jgi:hypothetical protein